MPGDESPDVSTSRSGSGTGGGFEPPKVSGGPPEREPDKKPEPRRRPEPNLNEVSISLHADEESITSKLVEAERYLRKPVPLRIRLRLKGRYVTKVDEGIKAVEAFLSSLPERLEIIAPPKHVKREVSTIVIDPET